MSIAKNTIHLTLAYIIQKVLLFIYFIFLARFLGPEDIGKYTFAFSFAYAFSIFSELGLHQVFIREVAKNREKLGEYLGQLLGVKLILSILTFLILILSISFFDNSPLTILLVSLAGLAIFLETIANFFYGVFRAFQNLKYESWGTVLQAALLFGLGLAVLFFRTNLFYLMLAYIIADIFYLLLPSIFLIKLLKLHKIKIQLRFDKKKIFFLFKMALPFAIAGFFNRIFSYIDIISLQKLVGDVYVGWYSAAYKLNFSLYFIPAAFSASLFPAFASYLHLSKEKLAEILEKSLFYLMTIALPITFGSIFLAEELILKIYGLKFSSSILPFQILMAQLVFMFLYTPFGAFLNASDRQLKNTLNIGAAAIINLILNLILIPILFCIGASIASLMANIILFVLGYYFVSKILIWNKIYLLKNFLKALLASSAMSLAIFSLKEIIPLLLLIILSGVIYLVVLYLVGGIKREDFRTLRNLAKR